VLTGKSMNLVEDLSHDPRRMAKFEHNSIHARLGEVYEVIRRSGTLMSSQTVFHAQPL
jgi:hypothetical protein